MKRKAKMEKFKKEFFGWSSKGLFLILCFFLFGFQTLLGQSLFTVNSIEDNEDIDLADTICADKNGMCTLRAALQNAKKVKEKSKVDFNIEGCGPFTIVLKDNLPKITSPIELDATTQPGYVLGSPQIVINGRSLIITMIPYDVEKGAIGFHLINGSAGSSIKGLVISGFRGTGIFLDSDNNIIQQNFLGTNPEGDGQFRNTTALFLKGKGNLIGGEKYEDRNLISGNGVGIRVYSENRILGNYIGTSLDGNSALPNEIGVSLARYSKFNLISENLISGNKSGIEINGDFNEIYSNKIGTNASGNGKIKNERGILLAFSRLNKIGSLRGGNLISGNTIGIQLSNQVNYDFLNKNEIKGNLIGLDISGTFSIGNGTGILINGSRGDVIGGCQTGDQNVISGNTNAGIELKRVGDFFIQGNHIGSDATGQFSVPNGVGIRFSENTTNPFLGECIISDNLISGNLNDGIEINDFGDFFIAGNYIGTTKTGSPLPNCGNGIKILQIKDLNCIGGASENMVNSIAFNYLNGIELLQKGFNPESVEILNRSNRIFNNLQSDFLESSDKSVIAKK